MVGINQHTRAQANAGEIVLIRTEGDLVVTAARIKIPGGWVHPLLRQGFILKHVEWFHRSFLSSIVFQYITNGESVTHPLLLLASQACQCFSEGMLRLCGSQGAGRRE